MGSIQKVLQCPFTWEINRQLALDFDESQEPKIDVDEQPIPSLMNSVMVTFIRATKNDNDGALLKTQETADIWIKLNQSLIEKENISIKVLLHIIKATEYFVYKIMKDITKAEKILEDITDARTLQTSMELGTLNGLKTISWLNFYEAGCKSALPCAKLATNQCNDCPLWHLMLGKTYRYSRRNEELSDKPSTDERNSYLKCYQLSKNPFYMISVAHMYRENKEYNKCNKMYLDIYNEKPSNSRIQLRLAMVFIKKKDFLRAKSCLDYVETHDPKNSMFLHYKGNYFQYLNDYKMAVYYYKEAIKAGPRNYGADLQYAECMYKLNSNFDYLHHLQSMLKKHESNADDKQQILLHIGMQYFLKKQDIKSSLIYFLQAIKINETSKQLKNYKNITIDSKSWYNIFNFIHDNVLPRFDSSKFPIQIQSIYKELKDLCVQHRVVEKPKELSVRLNRLQIR